MTILTMIIVMKLGRNEEANLVVRMVQCNSYMYNGYRNKLGRNSANFLKKVIFPLLSAVFVSISHALWSRLFV